MSRGPLLPGDPDRIAGYVLSARLGEGGQGAVFLGRDPAGRPVAVKLLHATLLSDAAARERFVRELLAVRRVARFCTAQVLDADTDGDRPYIVSEFVDGPSLHQAVTRTGPRSGAELDRLAVGTATALAAVHGAGIVHCDFKPANVLLAAEGPRVIDFGIARALDMSGTPSQVIGTPAYMAPEQFSRSEIRPAADVFAWGATVAYAANGASPFAADSSPATMYRVLEGTPDLGRLGGPLRDLVAQCLAKSPADRPTARELLLTLTGAPAGGDGPTENLRTGPAGRGGATRTATAAAPRPRRTRRGVLLGVGAAALVAVIAAVAVGAALVLLPRSHAPAVIPAAFAGQWSGTGTLPRESTTVHPHLELTAGAGRAELTAGESSCAGGSLVVRSATATELDMDFAPPGGCTGGPMTLRLAGDGTLALQLGDGTTYYATLTR